MTSFGFNVGETKPQAAFDPLPPGWYAMRVIKTEQVDGKSPGTGQMLKVEFEIIEHAHPEVANRKVWANYCHQHENRQTRSIARSQIAAICHSVGKPNAQNTDEILGGELRVKLSVSPADGKYEARNEAKGFKSLSEVVEPPTSAPSGTTPSVPTSTPPKSQPWKR